MGLIQQSKEEASVRTIPSEKERRKADNSRPSRLGTIGSAVLFMERTPPFGIPGARLEVLLMFQVNLLGDGSLHHLRWQA